MAEENSGKSQIGARLIHAVCHHLRWGYLPPNDFVWPRINQEGRREDIGKGWGDVGLLLQHYILELYHLLYQ